MERLKLLKVQNKIKQIFAFVWHLREPKPSLATAKQGGAVFLGMQTFFLME